MDTKNADPDLARKILLDAGADPKRLRVEQFALGWLVAAPGFGSGVSSAKDEAFDTPQEVAAHLVAQRGHEIFDPATLRGEDLPAEENQLELGAELLAAEGEGGQDSEHDDASNEAADSAAAPEESRTGEHAGDESGGGGFEPHESDFLRDSEPADADFEEIPEAMAELVAGELEAPATDGSFLIENRPDDIEVEEPEAEATGPQFIFSDDLNTIRWAKGGRLLEIAGELETALQAGWTVERFAYLQNQIVRMDRGEAPDDQEARAEFAWITEQSRAISRVTTHLKQRSAELKAAERDDVLAFDPEAGWPS